MDKALYTNFDKPSEVKKFPHGQLEIIKIGSGIVGKATYEPGWKWSESVGPMAGTDTCQLHHFLYHISGVLNVVMDDGTELICKPGDISVIPPGHDAWVIGDEPVVFIDLQDIIDHTKLE